jgi:hypothetical protein
MKFLNTQFHKFINRPVRPVESTQLRVYLPVGLSQKHILAADISAYNEIKIRGKFVTVLIHGIASLWLLS